MLGVRHHLRPDLDELLAHGQVPAPDRPWQRQLPQGFAKLYASPVDWPLNTLARAVDTLSDETSIPQNLMGNIAVCVAPCLAHGCPVCPQMVRHRRRVVLRAFRLDANLRSVSDQSALRTLVLARIPMLPTRAANRASEWQATRRPVTEDTATTLVAWAVPIVPATATFASGAAGCPISFSPAASAKVRAERSRQVGPGGSMSDTHALRTSSTQGRKSLPSSLMIRVGCVPVIRVIRSMRNFSQTATLTSSLRSRSDRRSAREGSDRRSLIV